MPPQISVIIPNLNSPLIDRTLAALRGQTFDLSRAEVLVVGLDEPGLVQSDELVRLISTGVPASAAVARNRGMQVAQGEILCFTDADCVADPHWLAVLVGRYADPSVHVVGGGVAFPNPRDNYWTACDNLSWFHEVLVSAPAGRRDCLPTLNFSLRREVVAKVGGMDETFLRAAGEDTEWTTRMRLAGYELHFEPRAIVHHHHLRNTPGQILAHAFYFGYNSIKVNPNYAGMAGVSVFMRHPLSLLLSSPLLAAGATARIFLRWETLRRYGSTLPAVFLTKMSWCLGAARRLRDQRKENSG
jgi:GT2 family glycosyltransferase